jgi:hypothetical protein
MTTVLTRALILDVAAIPLMLIYWWLTGPPTVVRLSNRPKPNTSAMSRQLVVTS